jgi:hypothetical protein
MKMQQYMLKQEIIKMASQTIKAYVDDVVNYRVMKDNFKTNVDSFIVTEDMDVDQVVSVSPSETPYTSNFVYETNTEGNNPPIITLTEDYLLPDDSIIEKGKRYLLYPKNNDGYIIFDQDPIIGDDVNLVGTNMALTTTGWLTGFNASSYATIDLSNKDFEAINTLEIYTRFCVSTSYTYQVGIKHTPLNSTKYGHLIKYNSGKLGYYTKTDGDKCSFSVANGDNVWAKCVYDGTTYSVYFMKDDTMTYTPTTIQEVDNSLWTLGGSTTNMAFDKNAPFLIGWNDTSYSSQYWYSGFDLANTIFKVNGEIVWQYGDYFRPYLNHNNITISADNIASGFSTNKGYLKTTIDGSFNLWQNYEFVFKFKGEGALTGAFNESFGFGTRIGVFGSGSYVLLGRGTNSWVNTNQSQYKGTKTYDKTKWTWYKVSINAFDNTLKSFISSDGINYEQDIQYTVTDIVVPFTYQLLGGWTEGSDEFFQGEIDLNETYFKFDDCVYKFTKNQLRKQRVNFNSHGNTTITEDGWCNNFYSTNNKIILPKITNNFTLITNIQTRETAGTESTYADIIFSTGANKNCVLCFVANTFQLQYWDGDIASGIQTSGQLEPSTKYWIAFSIKDSMRTIQYMEDGGKYSSIDSLPPLTSNEWVMGASGVYTSNPFVSHKTYPMLGSDNHSDRYYRGQININKTRIIQTDGVVHNFSYKDSIKNSIIDGIYNFDDNGNGGDFTLHNTNNGLLINDGSIIDEKWVENLQSISIPESDNYTYIDNRWVYIPDKELGVITPPLSGLI